MQRVKNGIKALFLAVLSAMLVFGIAALSACGSGETSDSSDSSDSVSSAASSSTQESSSADVSSGAESSSEVGGTSAIGKSMIVNYFDDTVTVDKVGGNYYMSLSLVKSVSSMQSFVGNNNCRCSDCACRYTQKA